MVNRFYFVNLKIVNGEYEKGNKHLVQAETADLAGSYAITLEGLTDLEWDEDKQGAYDGGGEWHYRVQQIRTVPAQALRVLRMFLPLNHCSVEYLREVGGIREDVADEGEEGNG